MNREKEKRLNEFIEYKKTLVSDIKKLKNYRYFLTLFLDSFKKPLKEVGEKEIIDFINSIKDKYSIGSMNIIKSMIKSFCYWNYEDYSKRFKNLKKIAAHQKTEKKYTPDMMWKKEDVERLVQSENDPYWKAYWMLFFYGGFRPGEVCKLEWKSITFADEGAYIQVYVKKNHRTFEKYVPENVVFYLRKLQQNNSKYVFPTKRKHKHGIPVGDTPLTAGGVWQRLTYVSKKYLNKKINPYVLRHSIATILYNRDDLKDSDVAHQLGHSKAMRETYNDLSTEEKRKRMKRIYIQAEDLPQEKKIELEQEIKELRSQLNKMVIDKEKWFEEMKDEFYIYAEKLSKKLSAIQLKK